MPTEIPFRLQIIKKIEELLKPIEITLSDGNLYNMQNRVFRNRKFGSSENDEYPYISINQYPPNREFGESMANFQSSTNSEIALYVEALVGNTDAFPGADDAEILLAKIKQALSQSRGSKTPQGLSDALGFGSKITGFDIATGTTAMPNAVNAAYILIFVPLRIQFVENMSNPFT